jgi:membrane associated rhomboid family serine protease
MMQGGFVDDFKNAFNRPNNAHVQLIIINVAVFVIMGLIQVIFDFSYGKGTNVQREWLGMPMHLDEFILKPWTLITYMFAHDGFFHILFNMLFLYWFGRILAEYLGGAKVINLYVLGGLAGALLYVSIYPTFLSLLQPGIDLSSISPNLVGASAGVFAVVFGTATLMPNYTIGLLFIGPVRIKYIALFYVLSFLLNLSGNNSGGELAHVGGALIGFVYIRQLQNGLDLGSWIQRVLRFFGGLFERKSKIKVSYKKNQQRTTASRSSSVKRPASSSPYDTSQDEIDAILDKISAKGYESLSKEEKQKLFNASKK